MSISSFKTKSGEPIDSMDAAYKHIRKLEEAFADVYDDLDEDGRITIRWAARLAGVADAS
jgi:hypothetical protein